MIDTLGLRAYEQLRTMLLQGRLEPGTQLVNRKLADEIGMSMTPVREAVTRLATEGLVEYVAGVGAFVRRISRQELTQLYDLRRTIEPLAAAEAAQHVTLPEIAELKAIVADSFAVVRGIASSPQRHATPAQMADWLEDERRFHEVIFAATRNPWLAKIASDMKLLAVGFTPHRRMPEFLTVQAAVRTWRAHRRLIRALAARDAALASALAFEHVAAGKHEVLAHLATHADETAHGEAAATLVQPHARRRASDRRGRTPANGGQAQRPPRLPTP